MKMTVTPKEIAEHLKEEHGLARAVEIVSERISRANYQKTRSIWTEIGSILDEKVETHTIHQ